MCILRPNRRYRKKMIRGQHDVLYRMTLFLLLISVLGTYAHGSVTAAIVTKPLVFGEDVTFQCLFNGSESSSPPITSIMWIKEPDKVPIANRGINVSTNKTKYTPTLYKEGTMYMYILTLHNFNFTDLGTYICEFDFEDASITFAMEKMDKTLSFVYIPNQSDVVFNLTALEPTQLNIWIQKIYPQPKCTVYYKNEDITGTIKYAIELGLTVYSVNMEIVLNECSGSLTISCLIGTRHFTVSNYIQQCCKGNECSTTEIINAQDITLCSLLVAVIILVMLCLFLKCRKSSDGG
ncbi:uncharacterized protein [Mytilus edulis]|uniref:uncharacterized protein n=1 Tax=Mytilus edulis TaxID=6550 RepID=UPI0039EF6A12